MGCTTSVPVVIQEQQKKQEWSQSARSLREKMDDRSKHKTLREIADILDSKTQDYMGKSDDEDEDEKLVQRVVVKPSPEPHDVASTDSSRFETDSVGDDNHGEASTKSPEQLVGPFDDLKQEPEWDSMQSSEMSFEMVWADEVLPPREIANKHNVKNSAIIDSSEGDESNPIVDDPPKSEKEIVRTIVSQLVPAAVGIVDEMMIDEQLDIQIVTKEDDNIEEGVMSDEQIVTKDYVESDKSDDQVVTEDNNVERILLEESLVDEVLRGEGNDKSEKPIVYRHEKSVEGSELEGQPVPENESYTTAAQDVFDEMGLLEDNNNEEMPAAQHEDIAENCKDIFSCAGLLDDDDDEQETMTEQLNSSYELYAYEDTSDAVYDVVHIGEMETEHNMESLSEVNIEECIIIPEVVEEPHTSVYNVVGVADKFEDKAEPKGAPAMSYVSSGGGSDGSIVEEEDMDETKDKVVAEETPAILSVSSGVESDRSIVEEKESSDTSVVFTPSTNEPKIFLVESKQESIVQEELLEEVPIEEDEEIIEEEFIEEEIIEEIEVELIEEVVSDDGFGFAGNAPSDEDEFIEEEVIEAELPAIEEVSEESEEFCAEDMEVHVEEAEMMPFLTDELPMIEEKSEHSDEPYSIEEDVEIVAEDRGAARGLHSIMEDGEEEDDYETDSPFILERAVEEDHQIDCEKGGNALASDLPAIEEGEDESQSERDLSERDNPDKELGVIEEQGIHGTALNALPAIHEDAANVDELEADMSNHQSNELASIEEGNEQDEDSNSNMQEEVSKAIKQDLNEGSQSTEYLPIDSVRKDETGIQFVSEEYENTTVSSQNDSKGKKKKKHDPGRNVFPELLNLDPFGDTKVDDAKLVTLMEANPQLCQKKYKLEGFNTKIYPLAALCALGASVESVVKCYVNHPEAIDDCDPWVGTPLHYACSYRASVDVVDFLASSAPGSLSSVNQFKRTPLHLACMFKAGSRVIKSLLSKYADGAKAVDIDGSTPLHLACDTDAGPDIEVINLLAGQSTEAIALANGIDGSTPLHIAVSRKAPVAVIEALVCANKEAASVRDDRGYLALHIAASVKADKDIFRVLDEKYREGIYVPNKQGEVPLDIAEQNALETDILDLLKGDTF